MLTLKKAATAFPPILFTLICDVFIVGFQIQPPFETSFRRRRFCDEKVRDMNRRKVVGLQGLPASCSIKREVMTFVMFDVFTMDLLSHFRFIHCFIYTTHLSTHLVKTNKQWLRTAYFPRYQVGIGKCPHIVFQALGTLPSSKSLIMALQASCIHVVTKLAIWQKFW